MEMVLGHNIIEIIFNFFRIMAAINPTEISTQEEQISSKNNFMHFKKIVATIVNEYASRHL